MIKLHFVNVGQGNMVVVVFADNTVLVYDCNITQQDHDETLSFLEHILPKRSIDVFVNSHRDADHFRGIAQLHDRFPIGAVWDSGVSGNWETPEYQSYMRLRRSLGTSAYEVEQGQTWKDNSVRILNGKRGTGDTNSQSIVLQIMDNTCPAALLAGDTDAVVWENSIVPKYGSTLRSVILYASHHGSKSFFEYPNDSERYVGHIGKINPQIVVISVGPNAHGHPDRVALELYGSFARGVSGGVRVVRTDQIGHITAVFQDDSTWELKHW